MSKGTEGTAEMKSTMIPRLSMLVALALTVGFLGTPARATETVTVTLDGVWWQGLDLHDQLLAVQGMIAALDFKCAMGPNDVLKDGSVQCSHWPDGKPQEVRWFSKPFGTYIDEINAFYVAHPKRPTIILPVTILGQCFADDPFMSHLHGYSCDSLGSYADRSSP